MSLDKTPDLDWLREEIIGRRTPIETPYGQKPLVYADYTASGRGIESIEKFIQSLLPFYANTHTDDDYTGKLMSQLLKEAETNIKKLVNAGPNGKVVPIGTGATGALQRLLAILGVYLPPATRVQFNSLIQAYFSEKKLAEGCQASEISKFIKSKRPIVFVGPYEHHSNEIMWRESLCEVKEIPLGTNDEFDLVALEEIIQAPEYKGRVKIGSFSAASNVTGILTPVYKVAEILHKHNAIACFDFAACAPYLEINMNKDDRSYFDAIVFSPHKFLGGPGSSGALIFNDKIYPKNLPPSVAGGGTVCFVTDSDEKYIDDIETRELAGTPGILQTIRTSLSLQLKDKIGLENIHINEFKYLSEFFNRFANNKNILIYGPKEIDKRINILPFNIKHQDKILHPKFVTKLFSELFGIQTRAGCSCAGPYGHKVLGISKQHSLELTEYLEKTGYYGLKPGWVRINLHFAFSREELDYLYDAIDFVIKHGYKFLQDYKYCLKNGDWVNINKSKFSEEISLNIDQVFANKNLKAKQIENQKQYFIDCLKYAEDYIKGFDADTKFSTFEDVPDKFHFFYTSKK